MNTSVRQLDTTTAARQRVHTDAHSVIGTYLSSTTPMLSLDAIDLCDPRPMIFGAPMV